ncbi:MAG: hypothetical protein AAF599_17570 [Bacteroidota bacterium]
MKRTIALFALIFIAGLANGIMDDLQFHFHDTIFAKWNHQYWNPAISWENKNNFAQHGAVVEFFMRTVFVWLTDGWHLMKEIMISCLVLAPLTVFEGMQKQWKRYLVAYLAFRFVFGIGFYLTYSIL